MKNLIIQKKYLATLFLLTGSFVLHSSCYGEGTVDTPPILRESSADFQSQSVGSVEVSVSVKTVIKEIEYTLHSVLKLVESGETQNADSAPQAYFAPEAAIINRVVPSTPPAREELPGYAIIKPDINSALYTPSLYGKISFTLEEMNRMPRGEKIAPTMKSINEIVQNSTQDNEKEVRVLLIRSVDFANVFLEIGGRNTTHIQRVIENILHFGLEEAQRVAGCNQYPRKNNGNCHNFPQPSTIGLRFTQLVMDNNVRGFQSNSSKMVLIMKLIANLAVDLNRDSSRMSYGDVMYKIKMLTKMSDYKNALVNLDQNTEPTDQQVDRIRARALEILEKANSMHASINQGLKMDPTALR